MGCTHLSPKLKDFVNNTVIAKNALGLKVRPKQIQANTDSLYLGPISNKKGYQLLLTFYIQCKQVN